MAPSLEGFLKTPAPTPHRHRGRTRLSKAPICIVNASALDKEILRPAWDARASCAEIEEKGTASGAAVFIGGSPSTPSHLPKPAMPWWSLDLAYFRAFPRRLKLAKGMPGCVRAVGI
jgi:hypothetical protein